MYTTVYAHVWCICVSVYISIHIYIYVYTFLCLLICLSVYLLRPACMQACMYACACEPYVSAYHAATSICMPYASLCCVCMRVCVGISCFCWPDLLSVPYSALLARRTGAVLGLLGPDSWPGPSGTFRSYGQGPLRVGKCKSRQHQGNLGKIIGSFSVLLLSPPDFADSKTQSTPVGLAGMQRGPGQSNRACAAVPGRLRALSGLAPMRCQQPDALSTSRSLSVAAGSSKNVQRLDHTAREMAGQVS